MIGLALAACSSDAQPAAPAAASTSIAEAEPVATASTIITSTTTTSVAPVRDIDETGGVSGPVVFAKVNESGEAQEAGALGVLELIDGCLYLTEPDVDDRVGLVWPSGTSWNADDEHVVAASGARLSPGQRVEFGGGYHGLAGLDPWVTDQDARDLLTSCVDANTSVDGVFVIQHSI